MIHEYIKEQLEESKENLDKEYFYWYAKGILFALRMENVISPKEWQELKTKYKVNRIS